MKDAGVPLETYPVDRYYQSTGYIVTQTLKQGNLHMYPSRLLPQLNLRFSSQELKDWIAQQAKANHRTLTAEINYHIEKAMIKQQEESSDAAN